LQAVRARRRTHEPIDHFFVFPLYVTSRFAHRFISITLHLPVAGIQTAIAMCARVLPTAFENLIPKSLNNVLWRNTFKHFPRTFAIVDASPIFITRRTVRQTQCSSEKFKRHCVKVQTLITPDGRYVHLSAVFRRATHDKDIFDYSGVTEFVTYRDEQVWECQRLMMGDLGCLGIALACSNAVLPHKRRRGGGFTEEPGAEN
jgi:hypothetical protein